MKSAWIRILCRYLIASMLLMSFASARAGMIGADQAAAGAGGDRAVVMSLLDRSDVSTALRANGVDPLAAKARVAAMTDDEVTALKSNLDAAPAGGKWKAKYGWWIAGVILISIILGYVWR